jgi:hypothetical protein
MRQTAEMIHTNNHIEEWNGGRSSVADDASSQFRIVTRNVRWRLARIIYSIGPVFKVKLSRTRIFNAIE